VDLFLVETIFDTGNARAALHALERFFAERGVRIPVFVSGTIVDQSGRTLSGQTNEAFWNSVSHAKPMAVGLNCALGATDMKKYIANLSECADCFVFCYPNAGLPDRKSTRLNSSHITISYAVFCLKKKKNIIYRKAKTNTSSSGTSLH